MSGKIINNCYSITEDFEEKKQNLIEDIEKYNIFSDYLLRIEKGIIHQMDSQEVS